MQGTLWFSHSTRQSSHMQRRGQGKTAHILDGQHDWTMPCKGLRVRECLDEELGHSQMRTPVERYPHAKKRQPLTCRRKRRCTLSNPRKVLTRDHSSLVSLSSRILSRFAESCSSQRSSSTKASTHYGNKS